MFDLFKRKFRKLPEDTYQKLASLALSGSASATTLLAVNSSDTKASTVGFLFLETLALATCLIQMRAQANFKFTSPEQIVEMIEQLQEQYRNFSRMGELKSEYTLSISHQMISEATTDKFFERTCFYAARDYRSLGFSDEAFDQFCRTTNLIPGLLRGAGINMALVIYQMAVCKMLFHGQAASQTQQVNAVLKATRETKEFFLGKIDRLLKAANIVALL